MGIVQFARLFRRHLPVLLTVLTMVVARGAMATDYGALSSGTWSNAAIWTPGGGPPGGSDNAYIGSTYPGSAAATANVSLGGSQSINNLNLGYGAATSGTLNLAGQKLTANSINLGANGGTATLLHNGGSFTTSYVNLDAGNSVTLVNNDSISTTLSITNSSQLTTGGTGNITNGVSLDYSGSLTLGTSMSLSGNFDIERNATLNMAGQRLSAYNVLLAWNQQQPVNVINRGPIASTFLQLGAGTFNLTSSDSVTYLNLSNSAVMTTAGTGNITSNVSLTFASSLTLGTSMSINGNLDLERSSTLNMAFHPLSAYNVLLGWNQGQPINVLNRGPITATYLQVGVGTFNLSSSDSVVNFNLSNASGTLNSSVSALNLTQSAQATTTPAGNVTNTANLDTGSSLTLGASMSLGGNLDLERSATLNMAFYPISVYNFLMGWNQQQPFNIVNRGPITANYLQLGVGTFNLTASDTVSILNLTNSAALTTATTGSVTSSVSLDYSGSLTLGASMSISGNLELERSATLNMAGHPLSAYDVLLGWNQGQPINLLNRGPITSTYLQVGAGSFVLSASDSVANFQLDIASGTLNSTVSSLTLTRSSQAATTLAGSVTGSVSLDTSSSLTLAASMSLSGNLDIERSSTLDMAGHPISAYNVLLGWNQNQPFNVINRSTITTSYLQLGAGTFNLIASDSVVNLNLSNSAAMATAATGNVTGNVSLDYSSLLTLGASMSLSSNFDLERGATLNMAGHPLSAYNVLVGWNQNQPVSVQNRAAITANYLQVGAGTFNLIPADVVSTLQVSKTASVTTAATGNITQAVLLDFSSSLTLGSSMSLGTQIDIERGGVLNMANQPLTVPTFYIGWYEGQPANVINSGSITANNLYIAGGSTDTLRAPGSTINTAMTLSNNSVITLQQPSGPLTGLTFHGSTSSALTINDTSVLQLSGGSNNNAAWIFRWQDVGGASWESTLKGLIAAGRIAVSSTSGYSVFDDEGYTYIATPSTLIWNGGGGDNNWSTSGNWSGTAPTAGHWLRFGALTTGGHTANNNNLTAGSLFYGIFFDAAAPAYNLTGNSIQLSGDVLNQSGTNQTIGLNIQLVAGDGAFNTNTIAFDTGAKNITDSGSISGSGMALMKTGTGTLVLSGTNTYSGGTIVAAGKLMVTKPYAILDGSNLTIGANALTVFGAPTVGAPAVSGDSAPQPVPEPGALAILAALLFGAGTWRIARKK
jgi:autotransporter-associated beta strand protein